MNAVLELQKLAHDTDGKGPAVEATPLTPITTITENPTIKSLISIGCL